MLVHQGAWLLLLILGACAPKAPTLDELGPVELPSETLPHITLVSEPVVDDTSLGQPSDIALRGDTLIVVDNVGNPSIHFFSTVTAVRLTTVGDVGEGPGDFEATPRLVSGAAPPGAEWFFDSRLRRVTGFESLRGVGGDQRKTVKAVVRFAAEGFSRVFWGHPDTLLGVALDQTHGYRIVAVTDSGRTLRRTHNLAIGDSRFSGYDLINAYQHAACASPDGRRVALTFLYAGRIDLLSTETWTTVTAKVPFPYQPPTERNPYTLKQSFRAIGPAVRRAYNGCFATNEHVYAVFIGRRGRYRRDEIYPPHKFVQVFRWDGTLEAVLRLDHWAERIAVDSGGEWLYASVHDDSLHAPSVRRTRIDTLRVLRSAGISANP